MSTVEEQDWYAIYTRPRWEKKVYESLERQGITAYCPLNRVLKQWSDRKKMVEVPLFTSYIFVRVSQADQLKVRMTSGVVNFVYWLGRIARIREDEIAAIRSFVAANTNIRIEEIAYKKGDTFAIENGILKGQEAIVEDVRKNKLELILKSMNVKLVVDYTPPKDSAGISS
jgi:transcription antitermination factor NusG